MDFTPLTFEHPLQQFLQSLEAAGAHAVVRQAGDDVNELIRRAYPQAKTIASNLPEITCATVDPDRLDDPRLLNGTDVGVVRGEFGVLENGMVWLKQRMRHKALFFIPEALVVLLAGMAAACNSFFSICIRSVLRAAMDVAVLPYMIASSTGALWMDTIEAKTGRTARPAKPVGGYPGSIPVCGWPSDRIELQLSESILVT